MTFRNSPELRDDQDNAVIKRYVHQPLTVEHWGIHASIKENGKVIITSAGTKGDDGEMEYDEVEIPASLVFKLATLLKATRKEVLVKVAENQ